MPNIGKSSVILLSNSFIVVLSAIMPNVFMLGGESK